MQQVWQIKDTIAVAMLAVCAYTDIKERYIYLMPLFISSSGALLISVIRCFTGGKESGRIILINEIMLPVILGFLIIMIVCMFRSYIGTGDGYLAATLGLLIGIKLSLFAIFAASAAASVYSAVLMAARKKLHKRDIPFAPFLLAGFLFVLLSETKR